MERSADRTASDPPEIRRRAPSNSATPQGDTDDPAARGTRRGSLRISKRARRDLVWLALSTIAFWVASLRFDLTEHVAGFLEHLSVGHEHTLFELDEALLSLAFLALGLVVFSWRRWHDLHVESETRERAERTLTRRQERLQKIVDQIPVMIAFISPDGATEWVNPEWTRMLGWNLEEVRQESPLHEMYPNPEDRSEVIRFALKGTREWREFTTRSRDGTELSTLWSNVVLSDGSSIGFGQDVTWRKRSEAELRRFSERLAFLHQMDQALLGNTGIDSIAESVLPRLRSVLSSSFARASIVLFDSEMSTGTLLAVERDGEIYLDRGERISLELFGDTKALRSGAIHAVHDVLRTSPRTEEVERIHAEGVRAYVNVPLVAHGDLLGTLNVGRQEPGAFDSEDLEIVREVADSLALSVHQARIFGALEESEKKYHSLYTSMKEGVAILEPIRGTDEDLADYLFTDVNPAFTDHTGLEAHQIRGRRAGELWRRPPFLDVFSRVLASGRSEQFQRHFEPLDRYFVISAFTLADGRFATLFTDITERQQTAMALERYQERLELLYDLSRQVAATLDPREVAGRAVETLRSVTGAVRGTVALFDPMLRRVEVLATSGEHNQSVSAVAASIERLPRFGALGWIAETRQAVLMDDVERDPRWASVAGIGETTRAFLGVPLVVGERLLGVLALVSERPAGFEPEQLHLVESAAATVAAAIANSRLFEDVEQHRQELQVLSARLADAEETERRRLARDLHDTVGQTLTVLAINLSLTRTSIEAGDARAARDRLADSRSQVEEMMSRIREVISELRPPLLDEQGLASTLHWYAEQFETRTGIDTRVVVEGSRAPLGTAVRTVLFRIAQEALTNAAKHAEPDLVQIELRPIAGRFRLTISDDGTGFDPGARASRPPRLGLGLVGMRERAEAVGGTFEIESAPGAGTRVIVEVPE